MKWVKKLFSSLSREKNTSFKPEEVTHESISRRLVHVTKNNGWGNAINFMSWEPNERGYRRIYGHKQELSVGDWFAVELKGGRYGILEVTKLEWKTDPPDMFFGEAADVGFVPDDVSLVTKPVKPMFYPLG